MDKADFLAWSRKYDRAFGWLVQRERELGGKFRKVKVMTIADLAKVAEWKFHDEPDKKVRFLELVGRNSEDAVQSMSSRVFCNPAGEDLYRINCLMTIEGVSPVLASVILSFFDPHNYGVFDVRVWQRLLGNPPPNLYSAQNYVTLLVALRKTAAKHNLDARVVEKALFKKSLDQSG